MYVHTSYNSLLVEVCMLTAGPPICWLMYRRQLYLHIIGSTPTPPPPPRANADASSGMENRTEKDLRAALQSPQGKNQIRSGNIHTFHTIHPWAFPVPQGHFRPDKSSEWVYLPDRVWIRLVYGSLCCYKGSLSSVTFSIIRLKMNFCALIASDMFTFSFKRPVVTIQVTLFVRTLYGFNQRDVKR